MIKWGCRHPCHTPVVVGGSRRVCIERECLDKYLVRVPCPDLYMLVGGRTYKGQVVDEPDGRKRLRWTPEAPEDIDDDDDDVEEERAVSVPEPPRHVEHTESSRVRADALDVLNRGDIQAMFDAILGEPETAEPYLSTIAVTDLLLANFASGAYETLLFPDYLLMAVAERVCEASTRMRMTEAFGHGLTLVSVPYASQDPWHIPRDHKVGIRWRTQTTGAKKRLTPSPRPDSVLPGYFTPPRKSSPVPYPDGPPTKIINPEPPASPKQQQQDEEEDEDEDSLSLSIGRF